MYLLSIEDRGNGFAMHRFQLTGPRVLCAMSMNNLPKATGPIKKLFLLDLDTLQSIWEMGSEYAYWPVGHRNHGMVAVKHKGSLLVFEAKTARVQARGSLFDIAKQ